MSWDVRFNLATGVTLILLFYINTTRVANGSKDEGKSVWGIWAGLHICHNGGYNDTYLCETIYNVQKLP